jgi:hypothetical protein
VVKNKEKIIPYLVDNFNELKDWVQSISSKVRYLDETWGC